MRGPSERTRKWVTAVVVSLSVVAAGALVWQSSYAAFSGETRNSGNDWSTGSVNLTDDDSGTARFVVTDIVPGQTDTKCITVTASASVPGTVKLYTLNGSNISTALADHIMLTVRSGDGGGFASCAGFTSDATLFTTTSLAQVAATYSSYATAAGTWSTAGVPSGEEKTYQFLWTFDASGLTQAELDALQGSHAGIDFEWELQNN